MSEFIPMSDDEHLSAVEAGLADALGEIDRLSRDNAYLTAKLRSFNAALTPSADTKAAYIGEVKFTVSTGFDEDGSEIWQDITVPWTTTKDIMAMILGQVALLDLANPLAVKP